MAITHLKKFLGNHAYWTINKDMSRKIGLEQTLVLQHLIDLSESAFKRKEIFQPISEMKDELCLSEHSIKKSIKELQDRKFINVIRKGIPFKNYYSVNEDIVMEFVLSPSIELNSSHYSETINSPQHSVENSISIEMESSHYSDENDGSIEMNSTQQSDEYTLTNTNNTDKEYITNNTEKETTTNNTTNVVYTQSMIDNMTTKFADKIDSKHKLHFFMDEINEDWGGWNNFLNVAFGDDTSVIRNYNARLGQYQLGIFK